MFIYTHIYICLKINCTELKVCIYSSSEEPKPTQAFMINSQMNMSF